MLENLLVPLDGSALALAALPAAASVAQATGARITLLHVIERKAPEQVHHERHLREAAEAEAYLQEIAERCLPAGVRAERHVHAAGVDDVAAGIVQHIEELRPDLIIMCTHGHHHLRQWVFGSVAEQVVAMGTMPVLLIPPKDKLECESFGSRKMLVPLDGEAAHEQGLPLVAELAKACGASVHLMTVVATVGSLRGVRAATASMLPGTMTAMLEIEQENAGRYLEGLRERFDRLGVSVECSVRRGKRVQTILEAAGETKADMIVLSTHGKKGTKAFWSASVGPRVAQKARAPVLLVPIR